MSPFSFIILTFNLFSESICEVDLPVANRIKAMLKNKSYGLSLHQVFGIIERMGRLHENNLIRMYAQTWRSLKQLRLGVEAEEPTESGYRAWLVAREALVCVISDSYCHNGTEVEDKKAELLLYWALFPGDGDQLVEQLSLLLGELYGIKNPWRELIEALRIEVNDAFIPD